MIALHVLAVIGGSLVVLATLISALETVVLPRERFTHIARFVFAVVDRLLIRQWRNKARQANLRALYAPVALVSLPLVWMIIVTAGFSFVFWGIGHQSALRSFEVSGSSLFTLGFAEPSGFGRIWLTFIEATIGLGLVALLISYLPTIYAAHHEREKGITVLRPFAGTPADPVGMLSNLQRLGALDNPDLWRSATNWLLELDQTHSAFPALSYFPEASQEQSWVASVGTMLDGAAILISVSTSTAEEFPNDAEKGPMLALAYGIPAMARIGSATSLPIDRSVRLADLMSRFGEPAPALSIRREEYVAALGQLTTLVTVADGEVESRWQRFAWIRSGYDRPLRGLAGLTMASTAPWTTDRPATVGRPRLVTQRPLKVDWAFDGNRDV
jgi:hypothetical protein